MWELLTQGQRSDVSSPGTDDGVYFLRRESSVACRHLSYISIRGGILSCSIIFLVQVWQWRILTIKMETLCVKSNIINFYNFVIQIFLTKETWSLCYLAVFFGFYLHYLHSEMRYDFRWVLLVVRRFLHSCFKAWDVKNCSAVLSTMKRIHRNGTWVTSEVLV